MRGRRGGGGGCAVGVGWATGEGAEGEDGDGVEGLGGDGVEGLGGDGVEGLSGGGSEGLRVESRYLLLFLVKPRLLLVRHLSGVPPITTCHLSSSVYDTSRPTHTRKQHFPH